MIRRVTNRKVDQTLGLPCPDSSGTVRLAAPEKSGFTKAIHLFQSAGQTQPSSLGLTDWSDQNTIWGSFAFFSQASMSFLRRFCLVVAVAAGMCSAADNLVFPYGAVYFRKSNPPAGEWERDHKTAAQAGMNMFRHWVMWSAV